MPKFESYDQLAWEQTCSAAITSDPLWKLDVYRASMYLLHVSREDCAAIRRARPRSDTGDQLDDAVGSISANLSEGYSRATRVDRLRLIGYAVGSARECFPWYQASRGVIPDDVIEERLVVLSRIRALLLALTNSLRRKGLDRGFES